MIKLPTLILLMSSLLYSEFEETHRKEANPVGENVVSILSVKSFEEEIEIIEGDDADKRPETPDIPLDAELLDYIYEQSEQYELAYAFVLAILRVESNFNPNAVSHTNDHGIAQINKATAKWIAAQLGLEKYDLKNPYTNIDFSIFYLTYLREQYRAKGLSEEDVFDYVIVSYNRGEAGAKRYAQQYGIENNSYLKKVAKAKEDIERGIYEQE